MELLLPFPGKAGVKCLPARVLWKQNPRLQMEEKTEYSGCGEGKATVRFCHGSGNVSLALKATAVESKVLHTSAPWAKLP